MYYTDWIVIIPLEIREDALRSPVAELKRVLESIPLPDVE
jgi:hypothetical protein